MKHVIATLIVLVVVAGAFALDSEAPKDAAVSEMDIELLTSQLMGVGCQKKEDPKACLENAGFTCEAVDDSSVVSFECKTTTSKGHEVVFQLP